MQQRLTPSAVLPQDHAAAILVGRAWIPSQNGPVPVLATEDGLFDLRPLALTVSHLLERDDPAVAIRSAQPLQRIAGLREALQNTDPATRDPSRPWLLAPCDLQALKASGVTFVESLLE